MPLMTNLSHLFAVQATYNPGSIAANTVAADAAAATVPGVKSGDVVLAAVKPTQSGGLGVSGARVTGDTQVVVSFTNATAAPIDAGAEIWTFVVARPDPSQQPSAPLP